MAERCPFVPARGEGAVAAEDQQSAAEIAEIDAIVFRDIEQDYVRPDYLLNAIWRQIASTESGYLLVVGPEGGLYFGTVGDDSGAIMRLLPAEK